MKSKILVSKNKTFVLNSKSVASAISVLSILLFVSGTGAMAQLRGPVHFSGLINDYTPPTVKGGPYEMHGQWTLDLRTEWHGEWITFADFSADMTMSDYGTTAGAPDATKGGQNPHTHHIALTHKPVTWNMDGCPAFSPATVTGFQINGVVSLITGNGSIAPFENGTPSSMLQVCVTGGESVKYSVPNSNLTLVFDGPATMHFGPQAIHGVVRNPQAFNERR